MRSEREAGGRRRAYTSRMEGDDGGAAALTLARQARGVLSVLVVPLPVVQLIVGGGFLLAPFFFPATRVRAVPYFKHRIQPTRSCARPPCAPHLLPYRTGFGLWGKRCDHVDEQGIERGYTMQVWLIGSGGATLLFIVLLVAMMFQSFLATMGFASAAASARDVRAELENGTATHETVSRHAYRAWVSDAVSQVTGTALSVTMVFGYIPLTIFSTVWFVLGNYWFWWLVRENTCNQVVYNVCWWTIVYTYAMLLLGCVVGPGLDPAYDNGETKRETPTQHNMTQQNTVSDQSCRISFKICILVLLAFVHTLHSCSDSYVTVARVIRKERKRKGTAPHPIFLFFFSWAKLDG